MVLNTQKGVNINYGSVVMNNLTEKLSGHRTDIEGFSSWVTASNNYTASNIIPLLTDTGSYDFRPINTGSIVDAGNTTYTNFEFSASGVDALTADIGAMEYNGTQWQAGITYDVSNRFNFY